MLSTNIKKTQNRKKRLNTEVCVARTMTKRKYELQSIVG